jgi:hypothetical protein
MEIWTQVFIRHVARLENRDLLVDQSGIVKPTTWWCAHPGRWLGREPEVLENGAAGFARGEDGEDAHAAATGVANQDIDGEHALEQVGPGESTARGGTGLIGSGSVHDSGAEVVMGREYAMIASEMTARWRNQGRQAAEEIDRCECEFGRVLPAKVREDTRHVLLPSAGQAPLSRARAEEPVPCGHAHDAAASARRRVGCELRALRRRHRALSSALHASALRAAARDDRAAPHSWVSYACRAVVRADARARAARQLERTCGATGRYAAAGEARASVARKVQGNHAAGSAATSASWTSNATR